MHPALRRYVFPLVLVLSAGAALADGPDVVELNEAGLEHSRAGRHRAAVTAFEAALELEPGDETLRRNLALARGNLGARLLGEGKLLEAEEWTRLALVLAPEDTVLLLNLAGCLDGRGFPARARTYVREAARLDPDDPRVLERLGQVLYREGRTAEAVAAWEKALAAGRGGAELARRLQLARAAEAVEADLHEQASGSFRILYDLERHGVVASRVLRALGEARLELAARLERPGPESLRIVLTDYADFRATTGSHRWVVGIYDGQIRLPVREDGQGIEQLLVKARHEYVHAALDPLGRRAPSWLHEGLAQLAEGKRELTARAAVRRGPAVPFDQLQRSFAGEQNAGTARRLYDTSLAFVSWLSTGERTGAFRAMMHGLFEGDSLRAAVETAYDDTLESLYDEFQDGIARP